VQWRKDSVPAWAVQIPLVTLIVLKLTGVIIWSWWWVLAPFWIGGILLALGVCALLIGLRWQARKQTRLWLDQLGSERLAEFMAGRADPDASGEHLGFGMGDKKPNPSDG
jgi:hypothetical protein